MKNHIIDFLLLLTFLFLFPISAAEKAIIDIDFSKAEKLWNLQMKGICRGPLPDRVSPDFPAWNSSEVLTEAKSENEEKYLRIKIERLQGFVLFRMSPETLIPFPGYYRMELEYRTPDSMHELWVRRDKAPLYPCLASVKIPQSTQWTKRSFPVCLRKQLEGANPNDSTAVKPNEVTLRLNLSIGKIDIRRFRLLPCSQEEYDQYANSFLKTSSKDAKNFFRNSRFPLGLPSGWTGNAKVSDISGPTGTFALRFVHSAIFSEPFLPGPEVRDCIISFFCKGNFGASILDRDSKELKKITFPPSGEWQRVSFQFSPRQPLERGYALFIYGNGLIDGITAANAANNGAEKYASAGACEIALAPGDGLISIHRIQFEDESPIVRWKATGDWQGAMLRAKVFNIYGEEKILPPIVIPPDGNGEISYSVFPGKNLGAFRIEVWAEKSGKRVSPYNELVMTRIRRPVYEGKDAPDSPFGIHVGPSTGKCEILKAAGVNWVRLHDSYMDATSWAYVEKKKGVWTIPDKGIDVYRKHYLKVLGWLGGTPAWASYNPNTKRIPLFAAYAVPKDLDAFRIYVRKIISFYRGRIDEWHFGNEPWNPLFWNASLTDGDPKHSATPAKDFADLQKIAYEELKKTAPEVKMYGFSTMLDYNNFWTKGCFDAGAYDSCDALDYHHYETPEYGYPHDKIEEGFQAAWGYIRRKGKELKPVIMTEGCFNLTGTDACGIYNHSITWQGNDASALHANLCVRYHIGLLMAGVKRIFLYSDTFGQFTLRQSSYACLLQSDGFPRPTLPAYSNMAWLLEDRKIAKTSQLAPDVWSVWFTGKGKTVAVITGKMGAEWTGILPHQINGYDLFGNPVLDRIRYRGEFLYFVADEQNKEFLPGGKLYDGGGGRQAN